MAPFRGGLCVSLTPATLDDVFQSDLTGADVVEIRLDYLNHPQDSLTADWKKLPLPVIAVCRREERGGRFQGTVAEERSILEAAVRNAAVAIDIDYRDALPFEGAQVIGSFHDFHSTPADIERQLVLACESPAQIAKVATTVRSWDDNRRLLDLLSHPWSRPVIVVGMGEMGQITRLIGPSRGSFLTYATTTQPSGEAAAPGQLSLREMLDVYGFRRIQRDTKLIGVLGNPVGHSRSPLIHNRAFATTGLDFAYLKFPAEDVADFFQNAQAIGIHGMSVTIPHKTAVMDYISVMADAAIEAGAVNTVVNDAGLWLGDNTDVAGVRAALASAECSPIGKNIVILGSGGAARSAVAAVKGAASILVLSRSEKSQEGCAANVQFDLLENAGKQRCDILINATPVGMYPAVDPSPMPNPIHAEVVFDMVYNPPMTTLLHAAESQGKVIISGTTMFLAQAERQFQIWTGVPAPEGLYTSEILQP